METTTSRNWRKYRTPHSEDWRANTERATEKIPENIALKKEIRHPVIREATNKDEHGNQEAQEDVTTERKEHEINK